MPLYFFPIIVFSCLVFHFLFGRSRMRRMERIPLPVGDKQYIETFIQTSITLSMISLSICFFVALIHSFIPKWNSFLFPFELLDSKVLDYFGMFLVKLAFISNVVIYFQITDKYSFGSSELTCQKIMKMELLVQFTTVLLSAGVFIFISNIVSLMVFCASLALFLYNRTR